MSLRFRVLRHRIGCFEIIVLVPIACFCRVSDNTLGTIEKALYSLFNSFVSALLPIKDLLK